MTPKTSYNSHNTVIVVINTGYMIEDVFPKTYATKQKKASIFSRIEAFWNDISDISTCSEINTGINKGNS